MIESVRDSDSPTHKEAVCSEIFGRFIGLVESAGFTKGQEYETQVRPIFSCSQKILWLDRVSETHQMTLVVKSLDCSVEYGLVRKSDMEVVHREKITDLRYRISPGSSCELTEGSEKKTQQMLANFKARFDELKKPNGARLDD